MDTITEHKVDRSGWGPGPWDGEPDRAEWRTTAGLHAIAHRVDHGAWCGYVAVPPGHPMHGKSDGDSEVYALEVHGGITYGAACRTPICHVAPPGEPDDVWWLGFDCIHCDDFAPRLSPNRSAFLYSGEGAGGTYRTLEYVREQCESLARQLADLGAP